MKFEQREQRLVIGSLFGPGGLSQVASKSNSGYRNTNVRLLFHLFNNLTLCFVAETVT